MTELRMNEVFSYTDEIAQNSPDTTQITPFSSPCLQPMNTYMSSTEILKIHSSLIENFYNSEREIYESKEDSEEIEYRKEEENNPN
mmetsp:Transcript_10838/g.9565  ORF Transcript_10838/g.9565 Transcript_10838/m.9565 type:complete len:86 (-) Transcript_10838:104-361(-)